MTAATPAEKLTMYAAGLVQGITLVTFPAASTIFTSAASYGLSAGQYGTMFVPQVIAAISASLAGARLAGRLGWKLVYLAGLTAKSGVDGAADRQLARRDRPVARLPDPVGPLRSAGVTLPEIYGASAAVAVLLAVLSFAIAAGRPSPAALHPRPASHLR